MFYQREDPFLSRSEGRVGKALLQLELPSRLQVADERPHQPPEDTLVDPVLKSTVAGLVGGVALGQVLPPGAGAKNPQDAAQNVARGNPRAAASVAATDGLGDQRLHNGPLRIGQVHAL